MRDPFDAWYIRLPDGRVVRAKSTASVRHHVESGQIPVESWVRRRGDEDWTALEWAAEFADVVSSRRKKSLRAENSNDPEPMVASNGSPRAHDELRTVGMRGLVEELLTALDSTLNKRKLIIAGLCCVAVSAILVAADIVAFWVWESPWPWAGGMAFACAAIVMLGMGAGLLTRITCIELTRFRQPRTQEIYAQLLSLFGRVTGCFVVVAGGVLLGIAALRLLPGWVSANAVAEPVPALAVAVCLLLEVLLWPVIGLSLLLGPVVVVEEAALLQAIRLWWSLVRRNLGRVLLYEGLALAIAVVMTVPFMLPVWLATSQGLDGQPAQVTLSLLTGAALTPMFAYLVVANVFIYLNLRYEFSASGRE